jgi:hypothetical protein
VPRRGNNKDDDDDDDALVDHILGEWKGKKRNK